MYINRIVILNIYDLTGPHYYLSKAVGWTCLIYWVMVAHRYKHKLFKRMLDETQTDMHIEIKTPHISTWYDRFLPTQVLLHSYRTELGTLMYSMWIQSHCTETLYIGIVTIKILLKGKVSTEFSELPCLFSWDATTVSSVYSWLIVFHFFFSLHTVSFGFCFK